MLYWSKFEIFADNSLHVHVVKMMIYVLKRIRSIVVKEKENNQLVIFYMKNIARGFFVSC